MTTSDSFDVNSLRFEAAVRQLEEAVGELEGGQLGLDGALAKYQLGIQLLTRCYALLDGAEQMVALLRGVDAQGNPETTPFDATATAERASGGQDSPCSGPGEPDPC